MEKKKIWNSVQQDAQFAHIMFAFLLFPILGRYLFLTSPVRRMMLGFYGIVNSIP